MSKYRFKTKDEFIRDGRWDDEYSVPLGWSVHGGMNGFLGQDVPKELNKECDEGIGFIIYGWRFAPADYALKEENTVNTNGFEYFGDTLMGVSYDKKTWETRVVFGKKNNKYIAWAGRDNLEEAKYEYLTVSWRYARPIKTTLTLQEIADKFGLNKDRS